MFNNCKNSKKQGDIGLALAIAYFTCNDYTISIPLTDSQDYDLIADKNNKLYRVQVKSTSYMQNNSYRISLTIKGGNRSGINKIKKLNPDNVDLIFIVTSINQQYVIPISEIAGQSTIALCSKYDKFKVS